MNSTRTLLAHYRTPLISFIGKRTVPKNIDHSPRPHPESSTHSLPNSFAQYRQNAQQHGPLARNSNSAMELKEGEVFDRNQLPRRFWRMRLSPEEMEIIESGGAAAFA